MILGVEVREDAIVVVVTDDRGVITARGKREGSNPTSAADAVRAAVSGTSLSAVGIAVRDPLEESISSIIAAAAGAAINHNDLTALLYLQGYADSEIIRED